MSCELTQSVLHGYIDGELDAARAADFERHLLSCPQCTSALESQETLRSSIQRAGLYERAPVALRQKVEAQFRMPAPVAIAPVRARMRPTALARSGCGADSRFFYRSASAPGPQRPRWHKPNWRRRLSMLIFARYSRAIW